MEKDLAIDTSWFWRQARSQDGNHRKQEVISSKWRSNQQDKAQCSEIWHKKDIRFAAEQTEYRLRMDTDLHQFSSFCETNSQEFIFGCTNRSSQKYRHWRIRSIDMSLSDANTPWPLYWMTQEWQCANTRSHGVNTEEVTWNSKVKKKKGPFQILLLQKKMRICGHYCRQKRHKSGICEKRPNALSSSTT